MHRQEVTDVKCDKSLCSAEHYLLITTEIKRRMKLIRDSLEDKANMIELTQTKDKEDEVRNV